MRRSTSTLRTSPDQFIHFSTLAGLSHNKRQDVVPFYSAIGKERVYGILLILERLNFCYKLKNIVRINARRREVQKRRAYADGAGASQ